MDAVTSRGTVLEPFWSRYHLCMNAGPLARISIRKRLAWIRDQHPDLEMAWIEDPSWWGSSRFQVSLEGESVAVDTAASQVANLTFRRGVHLVPAPLEGTLL